MCKIDFLPLKKPIIYSRYFFITQVLVFMLNPYYKIRRFITRSSYFTDDTEFGGISACYIVQSSHILIETYVLMLVLKFWSAFDASQCWYSKLIDPRCKQFIPDIWSNFSMHLWFNIIAENIKWHECGVNAIDIHHH